MIKPRKTDLEQLFQEAKSLKPRSKLNAEQMDELNEELMAGSKTVVKR